jgi:hypothetical protein
MSVITLNIIQPKLIEVAQTTQYISSGARTIIDKFTITNVGSANALFSVNLVSSGSTPLASNTIIKDRAVAPGETYSCHELTGHVLEPSAYISTKCDTVSVLVCRASGRQVT